MLELPYVAGIVDGEGAIQLTKTKPSPRVEGKKRFRTTRYRVELTVVNTNSELILLLQKQLGGSIFYQKPRGLRFKPTYRWSLGTKQTNTFLKSVYPFLVVKKRQAELALEFYQTSCTRKGRLLTGEELASREVYYQEMRRLNKRGV